RILGLERLLHAVADADRRLAPRPDRDPLLGLGDGGPGAAHAADRAQRGARAQELSPGEDAAHLARHVSPPRWTVLRARMVTGRPPPSRCPESAAPLGGRPPPLGPGETRA